MAKTGKTLVTFILGAAVGMAAGYFLTTDKETREEDLEKIKKTFSGIKDKFAKKTEDLEEDIYNS